MKFMTFEERVIERTTAEIHAQTARYLMGLGIMTDEQIAQAVQQTPEYVASLRNEIVGNTH